MKCLVDSNILIYYINQQLDTETRRLFESAVIAGAGYSSITRIEVMGWAGHTAQSRQDTQAVLDEMRELPLDESVIVCTIRLREACRIKLPDAVIAATALTHDLPLMTRNTQDFVALPTLKLLEATGAN